MLTASQPSGVFANKRGTNMAWVSKGAMDMGIAFRAESTHKIHATDGDLRELETILIWETFKYAMVGSFPTYKYCRYRSNHEHS